jgi:hypothetical protein
LVLGLALALLAPGGARAEPAEAPDEIPVVGRPADLPFSEASGRFEARARAAPTTLEAEQPLTLTVTVREVGRVVRPPQRIDLRQLPTFAEDFYIEDLPDASGPGTWEFAYRLRPRRPGVPDVPSFPLAFYNPQLRPPSRAFQVVYTDPIPLRVLARGAAVVPLRAPEAAFELATGPGVLAREEAWRPTRADWAVLLLAPPLLGAAWYLAWRRLWPDAARQARRKRSRAARQALEALRAAARLEAAARAERVAEAVATYLRQRLGLSPAEPTPAEAATCLMAHGCPADLAGQAERFFRACDEARFVHAGHAGLEDAGAQLILAVEALPWPPPPS